MYVLNKYRQKDKAVWYNYGTENSFISAIALLNKIWSTLMILY